jgi:hypothetical protein
MKFPNKITIRMIDGMSLNPIKVENILINIHVFAFNKNDYYLGPFFSDSNGEMHLTNKMLEISADAEIETGIMDYKGIRGASPLVEIRILSKEEIDLLKEGRNLWGIVGKEADLYRSKKELLKKIDLNNNHLVLSTCIKVLWDNEIASNVCYELKTNYKT